MSCICLCKDTNFKANHNPLIILIYKFLVVYAYAKILILKQITTMQQQGQLIVCCICLCKDTNFKANHNQLPIAFFLSPLYMPMQRY